VGRGRGGGEGRGGGGGGGGGRGGGGKTSIEYIINDMVSQASSIAIEIAAIGAQVDGQIIKAMLIAGRVLQSAIESGIGTHLVHRQDYIRSICGADQYGDAALRHMLRPRGACQDVLSANN